jgi:hypothetical protein
MEMNGHLNASTAVSQKKELKVPLWIDRYVNTRVSLNAVAKRKSVHLLGIELRYPARS